MVVIDLAIQSFVIFVPIWLLLSFALFVTREEQAKTAAKGAKVAVVDEPSLETAPIAGKPSDMDGDKFANPSPALTKNQASASTDQCRKTSRATIISQSLEKSEASTSCETLPKIEKEHLTLWTRRGEQVVPTEILNCPIPQEICRLRWRNAEVIRLADLEQFVSLV